MNNRKAFREWLEKEKNLSSRPCKLHIMRLESFEKDFQIFEMQKAEELDTLGQSSESLSLYREFLSVLCKLENHKTTEKTEEMSQSQEIAEKNDAPAEQDYPLKKKSIDYIIEQNGLFKTAISNILSPIVDNENKPIRDTESVFDITTSRLLDVANQSFSEPMQKYVFFELKNRMQRADVSDNGFYYSDPEGLIRLGSCANAFYEGANENQTIIGDSLEDSQNKYIQSQIRKPICLVPDNLGDFGDTIKRQLKGIKNRVIQIPRSIAAVYQLMESEPGITESSKILCLDYNTNHLCRTEVCIGSDDSGTLNIIRMGRRQLSDRIAFDELANQYIDEYCFKNDIEISQLDRENLILSRDIIDIIKDHKSVIINTKFGYKSIAYDSQIASRLSQMIQEDISRESGKYDYVVGLSDFVPNNKSVFDFEGLQRGLRRICQKIDNKETIWVEYLPKLDLETVRNGKFEWISLISDNISQEISELSMSNDDGVIIDIPDNKAFFPAGQDIIYLPLKRDSLGETGIKDKLAKFDDKKILPLKESIHVELKLSYHYGDPDSYKLFATAIDNPEISLASSWCNEDEQIMGNDKVPEYNSPKIKNKADVYDIISTIDNTMQRFADSHNYTMTGGYNRTPPVDKYHHWLALKDFNKVRLSVPIVFSPEKIRMYSSDINNKVECYIERLLEIWEGCENGYLDSGDVYFVCDLDKTHFNYIKNGIYDSLSLLGGYLCCDEMLQNPYLCDNIANCIKQSRNTQYLLQLSTHIPRCNDKYGIWNAIDFSLKSNGKNQLNMVERSIGTVCWRNENWIFQFGDINESVLAKLIENIIAECTEEINTICPGFKPVGLRDKLETLLGLSRLKTRSESVSKALDCNSKKVKDFVALLKEANNMIYDISDRLERPFAGRIELEVPNEFRNVNKVLYPLIEILSDGNAIKLTGYDSDETGMDFVDVGSDIINAKRSKKAEKVSVKEGKENVIIDKIGKSSRQIEQRVHDESNNQGDNPTQQVDESEIDEVKISKKAAKLTAGLDIEGMNNEKLKSNAKFLKVYTDLIDLMQQYHPSMAKQLVAYGDDYMSGLSYLRKYYK